MIEYDRERDYMFIIVFCIYYVLGVISMQLPVVLLQFIWIAVLLIMLLLYYSGIAFTRNSATVYYS